MTRIYTRSGDNGTTGLASGERVSKSDNRIAAIGDIDELNCTIGVVLSYPLDADSSSLLQQLQHLLFEVGAELAFPDKQRILPPHSTLLEQNIDDLSTKLEPLKKFILPGGCAAAAECHRARAICRRAERQLIALQLNANVHVDLTTFINRLSDLLFVLARYINKAQQHADIFWVSAQK